MKIDPNSTGELPAVVRVAAQICAGLPPVGSNHEAKAIMALSQAHALIAAYNEDQLAEPSATEAAIEANRVGLVRDRSDAIEHTMKQAARLDAPSAKPMPTREEMANRFLCWTLPEDFMPDGGIEFKALPCERFWPTGTNLLTADQARSLIDHLLDGEAK